VARGVSRTRCLRAVCARHCVRGLARTRASSLTGTHAACRTARHSLRVCGGGGGGKAGGKGRAGERKEEGREGEAGHTPARALRSPLALVSCLYPLSSPLPGMWKWKGGPKGAAARYWLTPTRAACVRDSGMGCFWSRSPRRRRRRATTRRGRACHCRSTFPAFTAIIPRKGYQVGRDPEQNERISRVGRWDATSEY